MMQKTPKDLKQYCQSYVKNTSQVTYVFTHPSSVTSPGYIFDISAKILLQMLSFPLHHPLLFQGVINDALAHSDYQNYHHNV